MPAFQKRKITNSPKNYSNHFCKSTSNHSKRHIKLQEDFNRRVIQIPSNKQSESLYTFEAPTELTEDHWISSSKLPTISQQQLKKLIQPTLGKELTVIQKQKLQTLLLKYSILFQEKDGLTSLICHKIEISETVFVKPSRLSQFEYEKAETLKNEMLEKGVIREIIQSL